MNIKNLDPLSAHQSLQKDSDCVFIDVRTPMEYSQGHPKGAVNVPWALPDPASGMLAPSPDFVNTVKSLCSIEKALYVSCQSGGRSMNACRDLANAGFLNLVNVDGGFGGRRDPTGRVVAGWRDAGLPVER